MTAVVHAAPSAEERLCLRCGRGFAGKAGRIVSGQPVCPSCALHFRVPVPCAACSRLTRRLGRMAGHEALVCEVCRRRDTHATCRVCARHRRIGRWDVGGRAVCVACSSDTPPVHACPDCGGTTPGPGSAPCRQCSLNCRIERRIALGAELIEQPWVRELFQEFCSWDGLPRTAGNMTRRIDAYAACFAEVDRRFTAASALRQGILLSVFGAEGLRRQHLVVRFLVGRLSVLWDPVRVEAFVEAGRIEANLAASDATPWGPALRAYHGHLARDGTLQPKTVRLYLKAAASLLENSGHANPASLRQADVNCYLGRKPGQKGSLIRFLSYAAQGKQLQLSLPRNKNAASLKARETALLRQIRALLNRLEHTRTDGEGRAVFAAALSKIYLIPLSTVLALTTSEVAADDETVTFWPDGLALRLAPLLAGAFRRWASSESGYVFPGRNGVQPLSVAAIRHHLRSAQAAKWV